MGTAFFMGKRKTKLVLQRNSLSVIYPYTCGAPTGHYPEKCVNRF